MLQKHKNYEKTIDKIRKKRYHITVKLAEANQLQGGMADENVEGRKGRQDRALRSYLSFRFCESRA